MIHDLCVLHTAGVYSVTVNEEVYVRVMFYVNSVRVNKQ